MLSKWKINISKYDNYRFGSDNNLYRLPFARHKRSYGLKKIKFNPTTNRWLLNGETWTKDQLRPHLILDTKPILLFSSEDLPF